jgi:hypothetical protein
MRRFAALTVVTLALVSGCGGSSTTDLSASAEALLKKDAAAVAAAARAADGTAVRTAVTRLRTDVAAQTRSGDVSSERAGQILAAATAVLGDVPVPVATPRPTPVVTGAPVVRQPATAQPKRKGKHGHG